MLRGKRNINGRRRDSKRPRPRMDGGAVTVTIHFLLPGQCRPRAARQSHRPYFGPLPRDERGRGGTRSPLSGLLSAWRSGNPTPRPSRSHRHRAASRCRRDRPGRFGETAGLRGRHYEVGTTLRSVDAAIIGLVGVVVGGALTAYMNSLLEWRRHLREAWGAELLFVSALTDAVDRLDPRLVLRKRATS